MILHRSIVKRICLLTVALCFLFSDIHAQGPNAREWSRKNLYWTTGGLGYSPAMGLQRSGLGILEEISSKTSDFLFSTRVIEAYALSLDSGMVESIAKPDQLYELGIMAGGVYGSALGHIGLTAGI